MTDIGAYAFAGSGLESFWFGRGVADIPGFMFSGCTALDNVTIHRSVTSVEKNAFFGCANLTLIKVDRGDTKRVDGLLTASGMSTTGITFLEEIVPYYTIRFHRYDASDEKVEDYDFDFGVATALPKLGALGWAHVGHPFKGWGSNKANADAGKIWKTDGAWVKDATAEGKTLSIYAIWE